MVMIMIHDLKRLRKLSEKYGKIWQKRFFERQVSMSQLELRILIWYIQRIDDVQIEEKKSQKFLEREIQSFVKMQKNGNRLLSPY